MKWSNPQFAITHQKTMVIDNSLALIMTFNFTYPTFENTRNFAIKTTNRSQIKEIISVFNADWRRTKVTSLAMPDLVCQHWKNIPGLIDKVGDPVLEGARVEYMIWQDPWMAISRNTFIGSMLSKVGLGGQLPEHARPYPTLEDESLPRADTFYLFSSEPFPFERYVDDLTQRGFNGAIVDGEYYSWFGTRSYRRLKQTMTESAGA